MFQPWDRNEPDQTSDQTAPEQSSLNAETNVETETVVLESGWTAPDVLSLYHTPITTGFEGQDAGDHSGDLGSDSLEPDLVFTEPGHHHLAEELLAPGTETVGARITIDPGESKSVIVGGLGGAHLAFRMFTQGAWTSWDVMASSPFEGPDGDEGAEGATASDGSSAVVDSVGPVWLSADVKALEIVIVGGQSPGELTATILPSSGATGSEPVPAGPSTAMDGAPAVIPRSQWASAGWDYENEDCDNGPSISDTVSAVVVHHTVIDNVYNRDDVPDLLRAIYHMHVRVNGWCDIGYNYVVDRFGRVWEARTGSAEDLVVGGHAKGFNTGTIGVAMLGQFQSGIRPNPETPPAALTNAVSQLAEAKLTEHGIDPNGHTWLRNRSSTGVQKLTGESWHYVPTILGHRDLGVTSCPGDLSLDWLRGLPESINDRRDRQPPYQTASWNSKGNGPGFVVLDKRGGLRAAGTARGISEVIAGAGEDPTVESNVIAVAGVGESGYVLTSQWDLVSYGSAPRLIVPRYGDQPPVDLVLRSDGTSGWVLDQGGNLYGFGGQADLQPKGDVASSSVAADIDDGGNGYVLGADGTISPVGDAPIVVAKAAGGEAIDLVVSESTRADKVLGWAVAKDGTITSFGTDSSVQPQVFKVQSENGAQPKEIRAIAAATGAEAGGWILDVDGQLWPFSGARHITPIYGDSTVQDAVDFAAVGSLTTADFLQSDKAIYVAALYQLFHGRPATGEEIDLGVSALEEGSDRSVLAEQLARSDYWAGREIEHMYLDVLGRPPDAAGKKYWVDQVRSDLQYQELGLYFYGSQEYVQGAGSNEGFVRRLYIDLLNREPESEGFSYWVDLLNSNSTEPPVVTESFYASVESRTARARRLYQTILGVELEEQDRQVWADKLLEIDDLALAAEIAGSGDYYDLVVLGETP